MPGKCFFSSSPCLFQTHFVVKMKTQEQKIDHLFRIKQTKIINVVCIQTVRSFSVNGYLNIGFIFIYRLSMHFICFA